jgi:hypothetical protein
MDIATYKLRLPPYCSFLTCSANVCPSLSHKRPDLCYRHLKQCCHAPNCYKHQSSYYTSYCAEHSRTCTKCGISEEKTEITETMLCYECFTKKRREDRLQAFCCPKCNSTLGFIGHKYYQIICSNGHKLNCQPPIFP